MNKPQKTEDDFKARVRRLAFKIRDWARKYISQKSMAVTFGRKLMDRSLRMAILLAFSLVVSIALFYFFLMLWGVYQQTPVGRSFALDFPSQHRMISVVLQKSSFSLLIRANLTAFVICFLVAVGCQFLMISRYLYFSRGFFGKLLWWGVPLTGLVAWYLKVEHQWRYWHMAAGLSVIPTLILFGSCFSVADDLVPEFQSVWKKTMHIKDAILSGGLPRIKEWLNDLADRINRA